MRFFYSDHYPLDLPAGHRFPGSKYRLLRDHLLRDGIVDADHLQASEPAETDDLTLAHDAGYITSFESGEIDPAEMRRIGFPWSESLVRRTRATVGGAIQAMRTALQSGISGQLAGGTHHAHRGFGSGYCVYNDQAVAALVALRDGLVERIAIVDLDVHQGDGSASILAADPRVFVLSVHGEKNFPFRKHASDLDIALEDGTDDRTYLAALAEVLPAVMDFSPDLILYQSGVDPLRQDKLGRLALSHEGLQERDRIVLETARRSGVPVSIAIGGGYADPIEATITAYAGTFDVARHVHSA